MRIKPWVGAVAVGWLAASACLDDSITGTRPLTMELTIASTAVVDELVTASYAATGTGLVGVIVSWGDGVVDSLTLSGSEVSYAGPVSHTYTMAGTFDVVGTAVDQTGQVSDEAVVEVN